MRTRLLALLLLVLVAGCAPPTATPTPEGWTPPPPTPTPLPPTPTPTPFDDLCDRDPECVRDYEPPISPVAWDPTLDAAGMFRADVRLTQPVGIRWPTAMEPDKRIVGVTFYQGDAAIAKVNPPPPADADWYWEPEPGHYEASTFRPAGDDAIVIEASIDPRVGQAVDRVCLWNGDDLLDCKGLA